MNALLLLLAIYPLSYILRYLGGPFNVFGRIRHFFITRPKIGVQFLDMLNCPWCFGFNCGVLAFFLLSANPITFSALLLWGLLGSGMTAFGDAIYNKLTKEQEIK
jgi:hypothetical protein